MNKVNLGNWYGNLKNTKQINRNLAYKLREISDPFIPFLHGNLAGHVQINTDDTSAHIVYNEPYAKYQMKGVSVKGKSFNYTRTSHPNAGPDWINRAISDNQQAIESFVRGQIINGKV